MRKIISFCIVFFLFFGSHCLAQKVVYSNVDNKDGRDINFEIIGKMNSNYLIYKNSKWNHKISILNKDMQTVEEVKLDFVPEKTFNIDFVTCTDFFYMIYQYQKKKTLYCMFVKMDALAKKITEPVEIDTTQIGFFTDNKIYTTIFSENKEKIMVFKIHKKNDTYTLASKLYDKQFNLVHSNRQVLNYDDRRDSYDNFLVDNEGNFVYTKESKQGNRDNSGMLKLIILAPTQDTFSEKNIDLSNNYIDDVNLKIDNLNKRYLVNSFYFKKNRGNIEGLFSYAFNKQNNATEFSVFSTISDSVRDQAKRDGQLRFALNEFFIRQVIAKKDGGFLILSEDYNAQTRGSNNSWNRWDYLNNPYSSNSYYYSPYYGYYRPSSSFGNQSTRYYYANVLVQSINKNGISEWSKVVQKDQYDDDDDNFLSFYTIPSGSEIHVLFSSDKKNQIIADNSIAPNGNITRNPTLKSEEKGYQFMTRLSKQVGAKQLIIPCSYRGSICFARVDLP